MKNMRWNSVQTNKEIHHLAEEVPLSFNKVSGFFVRALGI